MSTLLTELRRFTLAREITHLGHGELHARRLLIGRDARADLRIAGAIGPLVGGLVVEASWRYVFVLNVPVAVVALALGTLTPASAQQYSLTRYSAADGLPSGRILSLAQDSTGYLWVGTDAGLGRYDGSSFVTVAVTPPSASCAVTASPVLIWVTELRMARCPAGRKMA